MDVTIIGTGYVGLVTGTCFAEVGHRVICVDSDAEKVKLLKGGGIPIFEPGLDELVAKNVGAGRLSFTTSTREGVEASDIIFIAVPTPPLADGAVDLSVFQAVGLLAVFMRARSQRIRAMETTTMPAETRLSMWLIRPARPS